MCCSSYVLTSERIIVLLYVAGMCVCLVLLIFVSLRWHLVSSDKEERNSKKSPPNENNSYIWYFCLEIMSFLTIRNNVKGPFLLSKGYIAAATHDWEVRCGAGGHSKSGIIRTATSL